MKIILTIYDYLQKHRILCFSSLFIIIGLLIALVFRIDYKEDITDFLPVDQEYQESMKTYQDIVASNKIVLLFSQIDTTDIDKKKITDGVEELINYRKISIEVIWWNATGLRVPNSSVLERDGKNNVR